MKKIISLILAFAMIFSLCVPAFASESKDEHDTEECQNLPVIIVRGMDFGGLYYDYGTENQQPLISVDAKEIVSVLFDAIGAGVFNLSFDAAVDVILDFAYELLKGFSMDSEGNSVYNVNKPKYPQSADNYQDLCEGTVSEFGMVRACIETFGDGHTYYVNYDWRVDPLIIADEINQSVKTALEATGHDKVNIVCASMGGIMTVAYLTKYGYEKVNRCLFMSSTFCGAQVASDILTGGVDITPENLYNFVSNLIKDNKIVSFLLKAVNDIGGFDALTKLTDYIVDNYLDDAFEKVLTPIFGYMLPLWGLVQPEDYDAAVDYVFGDSLKENSEFIKRADALQNMMAGRDEMLNKMIDNGVEIAIVASYGTPVIPVYENSDFNGDGTLETYQMSGYATVAPYGKTLGDDYIPAKPEYLSPDRVVDLSTALYPEYTYIVKNAPHVACSYDTDFSDFFIWLLTYDGEFYAGASEKYPQFMISDSSESLRAFD